MQSGAEMDGMFVPLGGGGGCDLIKKQTNALGGEGVVNRDMPREKKRGGGGHSGKSLVPKIL